MRDAESGTGRRLRALVVAGASIFLAAAIASAVRGGWGSVRATELEDDVRRVVDADGAWGLAEGGPHQALSQRASGTAWKLVNRCDLFGCRTERVRVGEGRRLAAEHEARLRALRAAQDAKLMAQRRTMEEVLEERTASRVAGAAAGQKLATAPVEAAAVGSAARAGLLKADAHKATTASVAVPQTAATAAKAVANEVSAIREQAAGAKKMITTEEKAEIKAITKSEITTLKSEGLLAAQRKIQEDKERADQTDPIPSSDAIKAALPSKSEQAQAAVAGIAAAAAPEASEQEKVFLKTAAANARPSVAATPSKSEQAQAAVVEDIKAAATPEQSEQEKVFLKTAASNAQPSAAKADVHVKKQGKAKVNGRPSARNEDHAARAPKVVSMKDGDARPRGSAPSQVVQGYWNAEKPGLQVASGAGVNTLSEMPVRKGVYTGRRAAGRAAMRYRLNPAPNFDDRQVPATDVPSPLHEFAGHSLATKGTIKGKVLKMPGWFSSAIEQGMGMGESDKVLSKAAAETPGRTMWSTLVGGEKLASGRQPEGQQLAAHTTGVSAGQKRLASLDKPTVQRGLASATGFDDIKVNANTDSKPLWDVFKTPQSGNL